MFGKGLFFILLLGGVAIIPYVVDKQGWLKRVEDLVHQTEPSDGESPTVDGLPDVGVVKKTTAGKLVTAAPGFSGVQRPYGFPGGQSTQFSAARESLEASNVETDIPLPHLLNFQVTPEWITQNWDRVTNRIGELDLQGWRVPYFRSGRQDDFAGSVTYYFDRARRVQRIVLHGYTSDAAEFVQLATNHYQMKRIHSPEGDLYVATSEGRPIGAFHLQFAPLLHTKNKSRQCELLLELNRRQTEYGMSYEFDRVIQETKKANKLLTPIR